MSNKFDSTEKVLRASIRDALNSYHKCMAFDKGNLAYERLCGVLLNNECSVILDYATRAATIAKSIPDKK